MATFFFETITPAEAAAFNPALDTLISNTLTAAAITVVFGSATTTLIGGGRTVVLGTTPNAGLDNTNFDFAGTSELFLGTTFGDVFTLTTSNSAAWANAGPDDITVNGGVQNFLAQGNQGFDIIEVNGTASGTVAGGAGTDIIDLTGTGRVFANGNLGNDTIFAGGAADNFVQGGGGDDDIVVTGIGDNTIFGDLGDDFVLVEGIGDNTIAGGAGSDRFRLEASATGDNAINGNAGNDFITVDGPGFNTIQGGQGDDQIVVNSSTAQTVFGDLDDDTILLLNSGNHTVSGGDGDDVISAQNAQIPGGISFVDANGDLQAVGGNPGATGNLRLNGNAGDDLVVGGDGADILQGGQGDDTIRGGDGNDTISGDAGTDVLTGGFGGNRFVFNAGTSTIADRGDLVTDFFTPLGDTVTFNAAAGNGVNYREVGVSTSTFDEALATADNLLGNGVSYVLVAGAGGVDYDDTGGASGDGSLLFADLDDNGSADMVVRLSGVGLDGFTFSDIV